MVTLVLILLILLEDYMLLFRADMRNRFNSIRYKESDFFLFFYVKNTKPLMKE